MSANANYSQHTYSLKNLIPQARFFHCQDILFNSITADSRQVQSGMLFSALPGTNLHGNQFANQASLNGAPGLLTDTPPRNSNVPYCLVNDVRTQHAKLCHHLAGHPADQLKITGITGTNGKTTISWLLQSILNHSNFKADCSEQ